MINRLIARLPSKSIPLYGIVGVLLGIYGTAQGEGLNATTFAGAVITILSIIAQYIASNPVTINFTEDQWAKRNGEFELRLGKLHGKGHEPIVTVYVPISKGGFEEIECDSRPTATGEIVLYAAKPFRGQARIR